MRSYNNHPDSMVEQMSDKDERLENCFISNQLSELDLDDIERVDNPILSQGFQLRNPIKLRDILKS